MVPDNIIKTLLSSVSYNRFIFIFCISFIQLYIAVINKFKNHCLFAKTIIEFVHWIINGSFSYSHLDTLVLPSYREISVNHL